MHECVIVVMRACTLLLLPLRVSWHLGGARRSAALVSLASAGHQRRDVRGASARERRAVVRAEGVVPLAVAALEHRDDWAVTTDGRTQLGRDPSEVVVRQVEPSHAGKGGGTRTSTRHERSDTACAREGGGA
jgi:hypothetical protein